MQNWKSLKNRIQESVSLSLVLINQNDRMPFLPREELVPYKHCKNLTELPVGSIQQPWHQRTNLCPHRDEERKMTGTWCTEELKILLSKKATKLWYLVHSRIAESRGKGVQNTENP